MPKQLSLNFDGESLKNNGMLLACDKAERDMPGWNEMFYHYLIQYAKKGEPFMAEDVRIEAEKVLKMPINKRAIGGIFARAARNKLIKSCGKKKVKNPLAHCANAEIWIINKI